MLGCFDFTADREMYVLFYFLSFSHLNLSSLHELCQRDPLRQGARDVSARWGRCTVSCHYLGQPIYRDTTSDHYLSEI